MDTVVEKGAIIISTEHGRVSGNVSALVKAGKEKFLKGHKHLGESAALAWAEIEKHGKKTAE